MQLFTMLEDELCMAVTAWLALEDPAAAAQRWGTHRALLAQWTPSQQQGVFQQALQLAVACWLLLFQYEWLVGCAAA